jgi:hypothetical protein
VARSGADLSLEKRARPPLRTEAWPFFIRSDEFKRQDIGQLGSGPFSLGTPHKMLSDYLAVAAHRLTGATYSVALVEGSNE